MSLNTINYQSFLRTPHELGTSQGDFKLFWPVSFHFFSFQFNEHLKTFSINFLNYIMVGTEERKWLNEAVSLTTVSKIGFKFIT